MISPATATGSTPRRPSFFILGHSKSGTTALAKFLGQHPQLYLCEPKEPNYFCPSWCVPVDDDSSFLARTEAEYLALFAAARTDQTCGEASAAYLYAEESAALIHGFAPHARLIMIFREPVAFLRSYHSQLLRNAAPVGETVRDLGEAIALQSARRQGRSLPKGNRVREMLWYTSDRLRYAEHYDRYAQRFDPEQILVLTHEQLRTDNAGANRRVLGFLGVDPTFEPVFADHNVGSGALRSRSAARLAQRVTHGSGAVGMTRRALPKPLRTRMLATYRRMAFAPDAEIDDTVTAEIRAAARPHVEALAQRLDRDLLAEWGYR